MADRIEYSTRIVARVPEKMPIVVERAADRALTTVSAYVRNAISEKLARDGFSTDFTKHAPEKAA